ncbi:CUE domain-containing protein 1 isoform X5 [Eumetopias jubatus]|nr:CUE domain-containing protein 1 isoform X5 [Eumetopias jubatus]XP_027948804.1 CUE domain-containing protein 1 isoform X5 [Eumetopias jubatus]XP_027948805.1 CUE domain-containing protein 1 isoform X5 [Eumetopias jubatus]XP_027948806.1 CUE domain-containing protein 1 isoform X5 [Eumetopias jubatus]XP_027948807.1 CUE domain-containing protein 1 isoform X5 [Eumetopias jubatus]
MTRGPGPDAAAPRGPLPEGRRWPRALASRPGDPARPAPAQRSGSRGRELPEPTERAATAQGSGGRGSAPAANILPQRLGKMTSLFRRSSSGGGGGGGGSAGARGAGAGAGTGAASQELNNSRPARQVRRLEFNQAMDDFKTMFPNMDYDIIECVLRANSGAVDATIDQLLQMNLEGGGGSVYEDSSDSEDSIPPEILERTLEPDSSDEEPPPVYSPPAYHMHMFDRPYPLAPPTPPPRIDVLGSGPVSSQRRYRNWNPPLLGNLPEDFLRILPQQLDSIQGKNAEPKASFPVWAWRFPVPPREGDWKEESVAAAIAPGWREGNPGSSKPRSGEGGLPSVAGPGTRDQENRWKQYLEDERIALFLQNEEFMKELQRNRDFLLALERDRLKYESQKSKSSSSVAVGNDFGFPSPAPGGGDTNPAVSEDALFRDKLKHMGKSTRRKLFELARAFSEKTRMRKSKRKHLSKHQSLGAAVSTANLLDDVEGHTCDEDFRGRRHEAPKAPKVEETLREGQ